MAFKRSPVRSRLAPLGTPRHCGVSHFWVLTFVSRLGAGCQLGASPFGRVGSRIEQLSLQRSRPLMGRFPLNSFERREPEASGYIVEVQEKGSRPASKTTADVLA